MTDGSVEPRPTDVPRPAGGPSEVRRAAVWGAAGFLATIAVGVACAVITAPVLEPPALSVGQTVKFGIVYVGGFLTAPIVIQSDASAFGQALSVESSAALLLGTVAILAGGYVAGRSLGAWRSAAVAAATFSGLCAAAAVVMSSAPLALSNESASLSVTVPWAPVGARAFLLAFGSGAIGVVVARWPSGAGLMVRAAGRMVFGSLIATGIFMLFILPAEPFYSDVAFAGFQRLPDENGSAAALNNALVYPAETAAVMTIAMGGCVEGEASFLSREASHRWCAVGTEEVPDGEDLGSLGLSIQIPPVPRRYGLVVLGPIIGFAYGSWWLGRRLGRRRFVIRSGAIAGVTAAAGCVLLADAAVARATLERAGPFPASVRIGASAASILLPAIGWGVVFGVAGTWVGARFPKRSIANEEPAHGGEDPADDGGDDPGRGGHPKDGLASGAGG